MCIERWKEAVARDSAYQAEYRLRRWDGSYRWHIGRGVPMPDVDNPERLWFGTTTDVHEQKATQELLLRSEKVAALGRMAATLAHDINNPLAAAMNAVFLAFSSDGVSANARGYLEIVDKELRRVSGITRQALGFYREHSSPEVLSVGLIVDEAIELFHSKIKAKHVRVQKDYEDGCQVTAIGGEIRQVVGNILANSLDALPEEGVIAVRVSRVKHPRTSEPSVRITLADNGRGIDPNARPHIFEPLYTTKGAVGTGLGLWVTKQLVEKHCGTIGVRSCISGVRAGTSFTVVLPVERKVTDC
jgi:signal transduction histidine kinase